MIPLTPIIKRLRDSCPIFGRRVGGTASFAKNVQLASAGMSVPHAFVIPVHGQDASAMIDPHHKTQDQRDYFKIVVCVDNTSDEGIGGRGSMRLSAADELLTVRDQLDESLKGWRILGRYDPCRYVGDTNIGMSNNRLWHEFEYVACATIDPDVSQEQQDELNDVLYGITDDRPGDGIPPAGLHEIVVTESFDQTARQKDSVVTWLPRPADEPEASDAERTAIINVADAKGNIIEVDVTTNKPPMPPTEEEIIAAGTHFVPPTLPFFHGPDSFDGGDGI